jgi:VanZ family protein
LDDGAGSSGLVAWPAPSVKVLVRLAGSVSVRMLAWSCLGLLAYFSLIPAEFEVRTGLPGRLEHAVAYAGSALLLAVAYPRTHRGYVAVSLAVYAGALEIGQLWVPGRHSAFLDWLASGSGAVVASFIGGALLGRLDLTRSLVPPTHPTGGAQGDRALLERIRARQKAD